VLSHAAPSPSPCHPVHATLPTPEGPAAWIALFRAQCPIAAKWLVVSGSADRAYGGPGDAAAVVLPTVVDLAEDLGQPEGPQDSDDGPRRVELAAERGELRRSGTGVMVVVQASPKVMSARSLKLVASFAKLL
jgi:hypothetical protein